MGKSAPRQGTTLKYWTEGRRAGGWQQRAAELGVSVCPWQSQRASVHRGRGPSHLRGATLSSSWVVVSSGEASSPPASSARPHPPHFGEGTSTLRRTLLRE